ncbi:MAG: ABC transporter permease, partial [Candidatus Cloacimonetes bacterium]|nr:ABC transporter permease [Candidatus Cloacimonadota bacterium]
MAISLKESLVVGFSDFWSRKVRSFVTIFGIVLGTMSIIVVLAMINGINQKTLEWMMERGGLRKITIRRNWEYTEDTAQKGYLEYKEVNLIRSLVPEAESFNPQIREYFKMSFESRQYWGNVNGILPDFEQVEEWGVQEGRFISDFDINQSNDVICIGTDVKDELFGSREAVGNFITVHNRRLLIIGIMKHRYLKNSGGIGNENALAYMNRRSFIPISTMLHKISKEDHIDNLLIRARTVAEAPELRKKLEAILLNLRHGEPVLMVESSQEQAEEMEQNARRFEFIFFLISAISLLVGGIVIANIMLASIQERTREIGIRITVGARRRDVFLQFLVQTVLVT